MRFYFCFFSLFLAILPLKGFAEAEIEDKSDRFSFNDTQMNLKSSAYQSSSLNNEDEEIALAKDDVLKDSPESTLLNKMQGLQQEISELRGQLELQGHNLKLLQQQQVAFYKDLDNRFRNPQKDTTSVLTIEESRTNSLPTLSKENFNTYTHPKEEKVFEKISQKATTPIHSADEQISYLAAYDLVKTKRFDEALAAMQQFTIRYPQGGYTANAQYWLGELYLIKSAYPKAIEHFENVLKKFPLSSKTAASILKIGYALAASGKTEEAKMRLQDVIKNYPDTPTAQLALIKLESLGVS